MKRFYLFLLPIIGAASWGVSGSLLGQQSDPVRVPPQRPNAMVLEESKPAEETKSEVLSVTGRVDVAQAQTEKKPRFGPYEALVFNKSVLKNVVIKPPEDTIYLHLEPAHKDKEIQIKISTQPFSNYRKWFEGQNTRENGFVLVSPANAGKGANELSDWLRTSAPYIEYWMDGELFLHLKRTQ